MATRLLELARPLVADDVIGRADLALLDADLRMRRGEVDRACRALAAEVEAIAPIDPRRAMTMLLFAAKALVYKMEGAQALQAVERALDLAGDATPDMLQVASLAMTRTMAGHPDAARTALDAAHEGVANPRGHLHTLGIAWPLIWLEEFDEARRFVTWAVQVQREGGYHSFLPQSLHPEAELDFRTGHWDRALAGAVEAEQLFAETNQLVDVAVAASTLARIEAARGHASATAEHAAAAFSGDRSSGMLAATAFGESALGHLELSRRQFDRAVDHLSRAAGIATRGEVPEVGLLQAEPDLIEALVRAGRADAAVSVTDSLTELATRTGRPWLLAVAARCCGLLSSAGAYVDDFLEALDHHSRTPTPFDLARTHLCFAERLLESGAHQDAEHHLTLAVEQFTALGARLWTDWARTRLRALTGDRPVSQHGLTPREEQVAQLVASGASNKDVASTLFVNAKTVEYHLANVYRKLGIRTRTELALVWQPADRADPVAG
jgi:DNA-binding CsgD family transcriptional regulator